MIALPVNIRNSTTLTNDDKHLLSNVEEIPAVDPSFYDDTLKNIVQYYSLTPDEMDIEIHKYASKLLKQAKVDEAWQVLLTTM